jgi:hypothetical protein
MRRSNQKEKFKSKEKLYQRRNSRRNPNQRKNLFSGGTQISCLLEKQAICFAEQDQMS